MPQYESQFPDTPRLVDRYDREYDRRREHDDARTAPATVVAAVACGTAPTPFLAIYAVLFIVHGTVHPVVPPDITDSTTGELLAGIIATVIFVVAVTALLWAIGGRRRWPFVVVEAGLLATALWFLIDGTKGGTLATVAVLVTSVASLVLILVPPSAAFYGPVRVRALPNPAARLVRTRS